MKKKTLFHRSTGFSLIEVMVALVVLTVGLLGMAMLFTVNLRGSKQSTGLSHITDLCRYKIEDLKDVDFSALGSVTSATPYAYQVDYGRTNSDMVQESNINALGNTWAQQLALEAATVATPANACYGQTGVLETHTTACATLLKSLGPYVYTRTFVVCSESATPSPYPSQVGGSVADAAKPATEVYCRVDPNTASTRVDALACKGSTEFATAYLQNASPTPTIISPADEKKVKVLCTFRAKDGGCSKVESNTTVVKSSEL